MTRWDVRKSQELCTVPVSAPQVKGVTHHSDHRVLDGWSLFNDFALAFGSPRAVNPVTNGVKKDIVHVRGLHIVVSSLAAKEEVLRSRPPVTLAWCATLVCSWSMRSQGQGVALSQQAHAHAPDSFIPFPQLSMVNVG